MEPFLRFPGGGNYPRKSHNAARLRPWVGTMGRHSIALTAPVAQMAGSTGLRMPNRGNQSSHQPPDALRALRMAASTAPSSGGHHVDLFLIWHGQFQWTENRPKTTNHPAAQPSSSRPPIATHLINAGAAWSRSPNPLGSMWSPPGPDWQVFLFEMLSFWERTQPSPTHFLKCSTMYTMYVLFPYLRSG